MADMKWDMDPQDRPIGTGMASTLSLPLKLPPSHYILSAHDRSSTSRRLDQGGVVGLRQKHGGGRAELANAPFNQFREEAGVEGKG